jgi:integrase
MPATVREVSLQTRTARLKLLSRAKPYYRRVGGELHLGYYRPATKGLAGSWIARHYLGNQKYETFALGAADDRPDVPADGEKVLTFDQALKSAEQWRRRKAAETRAAEARIACPSVWATVQAYIADRKARDVKAGRNAERRLIHHVQTSPLADVALLNLTDNDFERWRAGIKRGGRGNKSKAAPLTAATLARTLNDLRAALTAGAHKIRADANILTIIKGGLKAPRQPDRARTKQILSDADVRKLVEAAIEHDADFGALILLLAATGSRFDQLARVTVSDVQIGARRVMVPASRKGKGQKQITETPVPLDDDVVAHLRLLIGNRPGQEPLLLRWHHHQVAGDKAHGTLPHWERVERRPWSDAAEMTRSWRAVVAAAGLSPGLVPYSLRHWSVVRQLRAGLPTRLVAAAHDTSVAMVERHYSAYVVDATEDLLRRAVVPLTPASEAKTSLG